MLKRNPPSLVQLCTQTAIKNLQYIGDVGDTEIDLLKNILPHCNLPQLEHIENSTRGRDLSSVTNDIWKRLFKEQFGIKQYNRIVKEIEERNIVRYKWKTLFQYRLKEIKEDYHQEYGIKECRPIQICDKKLPSRRKRNNYGEGYEPYKKKAKGILMEKTRKDYIMSVEARNHAVVRRTALERTHAVRGSPHVKSYGRK